MSITAVTLACVHMDVTMREHKLLRRHSEMTKNKWGKTIDKSTKEPYEEHVASCDDYEVSIKPGGGDRTLLPLLGIINTS